MKDLLGRELTPDEAEVLDLYLRSKDLLGRELAPCVDAGVRAAVAALWNVVTDLGLTYEHLSDLDV